jgi:hypothetical protein
MKILWQREIAWWGSEKAIKDHWDRYKKLKALLYTLRRMRYPRKTNFYSNT